MPSSGYWDGYVAALDDLDRLVEMYDSFGDELDAESVRSWASGVREKFGLTGGPTPS